MSARKKAKTLGGPTVTRFKVKVGGKWKVVESAIRVPPIHVAVKHPTGDGGSYGDEATRLNVRPPGARDTVSRYEVADKLRELADVVAGTVSVDELAGAQIVLLLTKKKP